MKSEQDVEKEPSPRLRIKDRAKRCYELAARGQMKAPKWTLIHGHMVFDPDVLSADQVEHAWLELGKVVYDPVLDEFYSKVDYYRQHHARVRRRYTLKQMMKMMLKYNHYDAWDLYGERGILRVIHR